MNHILHSHILGAECKTRGSTFNISGIESDPQDVILCRTHILGPLRMSSTRIAEPSGASGPVVYSTAGDLGRLLSALCTPAPGGASPLLNEASIDRLLAVGERFGLEKRIDRGTATAGLELTHSSRDSTALLRWYPQDGRGVVVVTRGGDGIPAARRIAGLVLGQ